MAGAAFNKNKSLSIIKLDLNLRGGGETPEMLHFEHSLVWCTNSDTLESRSEIPWKFWYVVLEKDGNRSDQWRKSVTKNPGGKDHTIQNEYKAG